MPLLYDLGVGLYHLAIRSAAPFVPKAKQWVEGRKGSWERLERASKKLHGCIWMHCASVGEFEQGLPVLEALKVQHPNVPVLVTFYSPSGYDARLGHLIADHVEYLPADGRANAKRLVELARPRIAIFVKYEFWYHYLNTLHRNDVPTFLIAALFRKEQPFFKFYGSAYRTMLRCYAHIFVQDEHSRTMLATLEIANVTVAGDTRYDRVARIAADAAGLDVAAAFKGEQQLLICGSTWPADEALILEALGERKTVIVPHELSAAHLVQIEARFPKPLARWTEIEGSPKDSIRSVLGEERSATLLVDRMGLLARLYAYADVTYVGGGFGDGIHSILEAAAWGKPVIFGPDHNKFNEAKELITSGAAFEINNATELRTVLDRLFNDPTELKRVSKIAADHVQEKRGATAKITSAIVPFLENAS